MTAVEEHYAALFKPLIEDFGEIDPQSATGVTGFDKGGPVAVCAIPAAGLYLSCELSLYSEQKPSSEGVRYDLFTRELDASVSLALLTAIGNLSFQYELGDLHSIDVSPLALPGIDDVQLRLFSKATVQNTDFGMYEVIPIR